MAGSVNIKLRPIKIAFLVDPKNKKSVLEAIKINSFLWGGMYNPVIPVLKKIPAAWTKSDRLITFRNSAKNITLGYIDNFDPDYFAVVGNCNIKHLNLDQQKVISAKDILENVDTDGTPSYGVGLFEALNYFIEKELKFVRKNPLDVYVLNFEKKSEIFLSSVFGKLPDKIEKVIETNYTEYLGAKYEKVKLENYATFLKSSTLFVRRLTSLYLDVRSSARGSRSDCIFFLDAQNIYDVIDYWNLRAMGWTVIPVPKQSASVDATKQLARDFIEEHFGPYRHNPDMFYHTTIIKARSIEMKELEDFVKSLDIPNPESPNAIKFTIQHWYPRMWDEWARDKDGVDGCEIEAGEAAYEFSETDTRINAKTVDPKFVSRFGGNGEPRFANTLDFRVFGGKELLAQVIPAASSGWDMVRSIGGMEPENWRFSRKELVHLVEHPDWSIHISVPLAKDVFSGWMKVKGWEVTESSPGKIAYQMARRLNGVHGLSILSHAGVLGLLKKMEDGKVVGKEEFFAEINKVANQNRSLSDKTRVAEWLLSAGMIRIGAEFQCDSCQRLSWFSLKDLDYRLQCHNCFEYFDIPAASPDQIKWAYRAFGPFSLPGRAHGVYSVLLTLRYFAQLHDCPITPMLSFIAKKNAKNVEVDLGFFLKEAKYGVSATRLIFAECKSNDDFKKSDVDKMRWLAGEFPGAIIVFATLKKELSKKEKALLKPFVNKGRKLWKADQPYNPVLILTATELLSDWGAPECWKDAGDFYKPFAERYRHSWRELLPLCDITQQMYLGLNAWHEWLDEKRQKAKRNRKITV